MIARYRLAVEAQAEAAQCTDVQVALRARLPKLHLQAQVHALRKTSIHGEVAYQVVDSDGDRMIQREVIARYLAADAGRWQAKEATITPSHYSFRWVRTVESGDRRTAVLELSPKFKRVGLFKGELWLDTQTALPLHESGQFARSPSVFVKRIAFVRDYRMREGGSFPGHVQATIETRVAGRAELEMEFGDSARGTEPECQ